MQLNNVIVSIDENKDNKGDNMELIDVNVVIECGNPQYAIGSDKIIGYEEVEVCGECGAIIKSKTHKYCTQCGTKIREEVSSSQNDFKDLNDENGDNMKWTMLDEDTIEEMSLEEFEKLGTIAITQKEEEEFEFENEYQVLMKLLDLGFDFTKTNIFKEVKDEWFKTSVNEAEYLFDDLLTELVTNCDEIIFEEPRNIIIEEIVVDCSFDYDYGSISSTHTCYGVLGYNIIIEDID